MTYKEVMETPNFYIIAPTAIKNVPLPIEFFAKKDENDAVIAGEFYTVAEVVELGGHTIERYSNDGLKFAKGFCFTFDTANELVAMLPDYNLTYGVDVKLINELEIGGELNTAEWKQEVV